MTNSKWAKPPVLKAAVKLQQINKKLKYLTIKGKLERAENLLELRLRQAKRHTDG